MFSKLFKKRAEKRKDSQMTRKAKAMENSIREIAKNTGKGLVDFSVVTKEKLEPVTRKTINTGKRHSGKLTTAGLLTAATGFKIYNDIKTGDASGIGEVIGDLANQISTATPALADGTLKPQDYFTEPAEFTMVGSAAAGGLEYTRKATAESRNFNNKGKAIISYQADLPNGVTAMNSSTYEKLGRPDKLSAKLNDESRRTYKVLVSDKDDLENDRIYTSLPGVTALTVAKSTSHTKKLKARMAYSDEKHGIPYSLARKIDADAKVGSSLILNVEDRRTGKMTANPIEIIEDDPRGGNNRIYFGMKDIGEYGFVGVEPSVKNGYLEATGNPVDLGIKTTRAVEYTKPKLESAYRTSLDTSKKTLDATRTGFTKAKNTTYKGLGKALSYTGSKMELAGEKLKTKSDSNEYRTVPVKGPESQKSIDVDYDALVAY